MVVKGTKRRGNYPAAKYLYPAGPKHPHEWITCRLCGKRALVKAHGKGFCSKRCAQSGEYNTVWKGALAGYLACHGRVYRKRGPAKAHLCECGKQARDWANLTGNYHDIEDYAPKCKPCHWRYDEQRRNMKGGE